MFLHCFDNEDTDDDNDVRTCYFKAHKKKKCGMNLELYGIAYWLNTKTLDNLMTEEKDKQGIILPLKQSNKTIPSLWTLNYIK